MDQSCRSAFEKLGKAKAALEKLQFWSFASVLLCTRLTREDLKACWRALAFSAVGRAFPRLAVSLRQMLFAQEFNGCTLTMAIPADRDSSGFVLHTLSPVCQCTSMITRPGQGPRHATVTVRKKRARDSPQFEIEVPEWVAHSMYPVAQMLESRTQDFPVPRLVQVPKETDTPAHLQELSRLRKSGAPCRCVVPSSLLLAAPKVLRALYELQCFIERIRESAVLYRGLLHGHHRS